MEIALLFATTVLQNASFTLVSRARNSKSLMFHGLAAISSNGIWLLVIRQVVQNLSSVAMMITYIAAATIGSVAIHWLSMNVLEKKFK